MTNVAGGGGGSDAQDRLVARIVKIAHQFGIPPAVALAMAYHESGLNKRAVGDGGTSFGLYQLHEGGMLGDHSKRWAFRVVHNAKTALRSLAQTARQHPGLDWGTLAAMSQRPADARSYAQAVNSLVHQARTSGDPVNYFSLLHTGATSAPSGTGPAAVAGGGGGGGTGGGGSYTHLSTQNVNTSAGAGGTTVYVNGGGGGDSQVPQLTRDDFKQGIAQAGFSMGLINSHPELRRIFRKAISEGWFRSETGINRFINSVQNSNWFQSHTEAQRKFAELQYSDPAQLDRMVSEAASSVRTLSTSLGIDLSHDELMHVARMATRNGLTDQEIRNTVVGYYDFDPHKELTGEAGADVSSIKQLASQYLVPASERVINQLSTQMLDGTLSQEALQSYFQQQALSRFPHLKKQIEQGLTVAQIADPYRQMMADTFELDPEGIKYNDQTVLKALQQPSEKGDGFQLMPLWQFQQQLRSDPRWLSTNNARDQLMDVGTSLLRNFGLVN